MTAHDVRVDLADRSYDIEIGEENLSKIGGFILDRKKTKHAVVITDSNVDPLHGDRTADFLAESQFEEVDVWAVEAGERSKSPEVAYELWEAMLQQAVDRDSVVVAVGGGVVGDLAGFIAATFARGLAFFQIPTTLLAQVDSSVGGKVGVNLPGAKNMVGAFWQPHGVLIDVATLNTLPDRDYRAGLAEVVKYGVIMDAEFFAYLEEQTEAINRRDPEVLKTIIAKCCRLKAEVVQADEREESGRRAILNYGHTYCHAIEAVTGYQSVLHGEGVAMGMLCESRLAEQMGRITADITQRQLSLLDKLGLPTAPPEGIDPEALLDKMWRDKKVQAGKIRFVLPDRIGAVSLVSDATEASILSCVFPQ
ncbi:MAG: 3-dehydroquinate synthase [Planctomycetota bacterium]